MNVLVFSESDTHCSALISLCEPLRFDTVQTERLLSAAYLWFQMEDEYKYAAAFLLACDYCV